MITSNPTEYRDFLIEDSSLSRLTKMVSFQRLADEFTRYADDVADAKREIDLLLNPTAVAWAASLEEAACTEGYCYVCRRCTDHFGEHSMQQLLAFGGPSLRVSA